jgi:HK97 family phage major capsid protein
MVKRYSSVEMDQQERELRDFVQQAKAGQSGHSLDGLWLKGLVDASIQGGTEYFDAISPLRTGISSEGGALLPTSFSEQLFQRIFEGELLRRVFRVDPPEQGQERVIPSYGESDRSSTRFGGVTSAWHAETTALTESEPDLSAIVLKFKKLTSLMYASNELLDDTPAALFESVLNLLSREAVGEIEYCLINGDGVGKIQGYIASPAAIEVSASGDAGYIVAADVLGMWKRMWPTGKRSCVWVVSPDAEEQLYSLADDAVYSGSTSAQGFPGLVSVDGRHPSGWPCVVMGRPVIPHESAPTLNSKGDLALVDFSQVALMMKTKGIQGSPHLQFESDIGAFRLVTRVDGAAMWKGPVTLRNGSAQTVSPIVVLGARS